MAQGESAVTGGVDAAGSASLEPAYELRKQKIPSTVHDGEGVFCGTDSLLRAYTGSPDNTLRNSCKSGLTVSTGVTLSGRAVSTSRKVAA